jgi:hypothetical protein
LDSCARDSHWNSPQLTGSARLHGNLSFSELTFDAAYKHVFPYEGRSLKTELFAAGELILEPGPFPLMIFSGSYESRDFAPEEQIFLQAAADYRITGKLSISPALAWLDGDAQAIYRGKALLEWNFNAGNRIGAFYQYECQDEDQIRHSFGLQSSLRLDF